MSIRKRIDKLCRGFIWGEENDSRKIHLIGWESVCQAREQGGLGIRKSVHMNQALLSKLAWMMLCEEDKLWCRVLRNKYKVQDLLNSKSHMNGTGSQT